MTFHIFERFEDENKQSLRPSGNQFKLAGYNLLYRAWEKRNKPVNNGWHVTHDELLDLQFGQSNYPEGTKLVIDFHPGTGSRIGLIEILDIYAYTFGDKGKAVWTPLMLRLRDVYYQEFDEPLSPETRSEILAKIPTGFKGQDLIEFLYINGDDNGWNWGRNGMTNAAFLHEDARNYFRPFF